MGEIADMMLDGTMDPETGEWNFDGEDGPGFPMTGAEASAWKRQFGQPSYRANDGRAKGSRTGGQPSPPGLGLSKNARRRRNRRLGVLTTPGAPR